MLGTGAGSGSAAAAISAAIFGVACLPSADQPAVSRLFGGIHYPMAIEFGMDQGDALGALVVERLQTRL